MREGESWSIGGGNCINNEEGGGILERGSRLEHWRGEGSGRQVVEDGKQVGGVVEEGSKWEE